jgi:hypothetical protein
VRCERERMAQVGLCDSHCYPFVPQPAPRPLLVIEAERPAVKGLFPRRFIMANNIPVQNIVSRYHPGVGRLAS